MLVNGLTLLVLKWVVLCGSTKPGSLDEMIATPKKAFKNLECHVCHSENDPDCFNITQLPGEEPIKKFAFTCDANSTMCMVRRFSFTVSGADRVWIGNNMTTYAMKRNCSSTCEPGCVIMGERTRLYVCNSCCHTALCNVGNGSETFGLSWKLLFTSAFILSALV